jgi:phosphoribosylanthranilate isomerase
MGHPAVRVKICGVRRAEDAQMAAELGADAIGVLVGQKHPSGDFISAKQAAAVLQVLPDSVCGVLVSHLEDADALLELVDQVQPKALQIHSPMALGGVSTIRRARPDLLLHKAVHVGSADALAAITSYGALVDGFVADSFNPATGQVGGTGLTHDWRLTAELARSTPRPLWLAGGLTPQNVAEAIAQVQPYGVDVNSGVKGNDGFKNLQRLQAFIRSARSGTSS